MGFNLMGGLMAGANVGEGIIQGQQQSIDNTYKNNMQRLSLQDAELQAQQKKSDAEKMQQLSDYSMQKWNPTPVVPNSDANGGPGGTPNKPGQPGQGGPGQSPQGQASNLAGQQGQPFDMVAYNKDMAQKAASIGDIGRAEQFGTNAMNAANDQYTQQQKQATTQLTNMKAQSQALDTMAQRFQGVDDQASYDRARMELMSDPSMPQQARQGIAGLPDKFTPGVVQGIIDHGQTTSQSLQHQIAQANLQERIRSDNLRDNNEQIRNSLAAAKEQATEEHQKAQTKVGAVAGSPTTNDIRAASDAVKEVWGEGYDPTSDEAKQATESVASRGRQIMRDNRAVNASQAFAMAADEAKKNGEISTKTVPATYESIMGHNLWEKTHATTKTGFQSKGNTADAALPIKQGMKDSDIVNGKFYTYGGKTYQAVDGKLKPVQ